MASTKGQPHFGPELFRFLRQLKRNNERPWFDKNKQRYLDGVRDPMLQFIADFGPRLRRISPHFVADPRPQGGSMFRIYRDTRFSRDKSPYKLAATARFTHRRGKDVHAPGFYIHLGLDGVFAASGVWHPDSQSLARIRETIVENPKRWKRIMSGKPFKDGTLRLAGDSLKRVPRGMAPDHPLAEDLKRKDFIVVTDFDEKVACSAELLDRFVGFCKTSGPFVKILCEALDVEWK